MNRFVLVYWGLVDLWCGFWGLCGLGILVVGDGCIKESCNFLFWNFLDFIWFLILVIFLYIFELDGVMIFCVKGYLIEFIFDYNFFG